ncbi:MAG: MltA domain-containing protein [Betaproteobacteria bacterium]|nr:MltA domain-containing protein [Betaproteobacteria bacterium]
MTPTLGPRAGARRLLQALVPLLALALGSCASVPGPGPATSAPPAPPASAGAAPPLPTPPTAAPASQPAPGDATSLPLRPASFQQLPGWGADDFQGLWQAWRRDCGARVKLLAQACAASAGIAADDTASQRAFFEHWFQPWQLLAPGGAGQGLVTGYYEPLFAGSTARGWPYVVPLWGLPPDLVDMPAGSAGDVRRGRVVDEADGRTRIEPFWSRAQIERDAQARQLLSRHVVAWLQSPVDALFLQVQGSGLVRLPDGSLLRLSYAGDNGWPYRSVGRWLLDRGDLRGTVTMQSIQAWAQMHPEQVQDMLDANPRVVFFRATPLDGPDRGPVGALGVPLTAMRSVAVDKSLLSLGMPLWMSTTVAGRPLQRLVFAQDVGGAIRGALRADLFFGTGDDAGQAAGRMQSPGSMWLLLPRNTPSR